MAHQDYSEICPIFNEGVEKELVIPYNTSCSVCTFPVFGFRFGREVVVQEIFANFKTSTTAFACVSTSCTIDIFSDQSMSTLIGSLCLGSADMCVSTAVPLTGYCMQAGSLTSTAFSSTDMLTLCNRTLAESGELAGTRVNVIIRYRDK